MQGIPREGKMDGIFQVNWKNEVGSGGLGEDGRMGTWGIRLVSKNKRKKDDDFNFMFNLLGVRPALQFFSRQQATLGTVGTDNRQLPGTYLGMQAR